jgi:cytochrome b561
MSSAPAPPRRWSAATIALHWLSAVLVILLLGLGWFMVHADIGAARKFDLYQLHKSLGFLSLVFLIARLAARLGSAAPPGPFTTPLWERRLAGAAHAAFYLLLLAAALSGWLVVSAAIIPVPTRFFDLVVIPNLTGADAPLEATATVIHYAASRLIMALTIVHVAAALKHHFIDRDDVLARMVRLR